MPPLPITFNLPRPPFGLPLPLFQWAEAIQLAMNGLPQFSIFSTADGPNSSGVSGNRGILGIDVGSSKTRLWVCTSDGTNTWRGIR